MLHLVNDRQFQQLVAEKSDILASRLDYQAPLMAAITTKWMAELEPAALILLYAIMGRTISFGKAAEIIPVRQLIEGVKEGEEVHFCSVGMGENTIRKHLNSLVENDFLHAYSASSMSNGAEKSARMFEINIKKLIDTADLETRNCRVLVDVEAKIAIEKREKAARDLAKRGDPLPTERGGPSYINTVDTTYLSSLVELDKSNYFPPVCDAADSSSGDSVPGVGQHQVSQLGVAQVLPIPKKQRARPGPVESAAEVISLATAKHRMVAQARVDSVSTSRLEIKSLQALLDKSRERNIPDQPRLVVTAKEFGVLRKRVEAAQLKDVADFFDYCLRSWSSLAAQNRAARLRNPSAKGSSLPMAPTFSALAYRLPYFISAYTNYLATGAATENAKDQTIEKLRAQLDHARRDAVAAKDILRRRSRPSPQPARTATAPKPATQRITQDSSILSDDWTPPTWQPRAEQKPRRYGNGNK